MSKLITDLNDGNAVQQSLVILNLLAGNLKMLAPPAPIPDTGGKPNLKSVPPTPPSEKTKEPTPPEKPEIPNALDGPASPKTGVDKFGDAYDPIAHSNPPKMNRDGHWKKSRRKDKTITTVSEQHDAGPGLPEGPPSLKKYPGPPDDNGDVTPEALLTGDNTTVIKPAVTPELPAPPPGPTFEDLLKLMGQCITAKTLTPDDITNICAQAGTPNIASTENDPAKIILVHRMIANITKPEGQEHAKS